MRNGVRTMLEAGLQMGRCWITGRGQLDYMLMKTLRVCDNVHQRLESSPAYLPDGTASVCATRPNVHCMLRRANTLQTAL